jgi:methylenetetrahydrofolate dehydrogenase (NADP+) / methenyltetrahydrofolate cyclohydrolase
LGSIIDGKSIAKKYREEVKKFVFEKKQKGFRVPCLASILVGNDGGSIYYMNNQSKLCRELGVNPREFSLSENAKLEELMELIKKLNEDITVDGIILQMPLPDHLNEREITSMISPEKDVDGLTDVNIGRLYKGDKCFVPCTPKGIIELVKSTGCSIQGKNAVVIGRSNIVGKPVAQLLMNENATVTICHSKTKDIKDICKKADILVAALGKPSFVDESFIKEGAVVIDVGTTMVNNKICGDVIFDRVIEKAAFVTPVPGGVGSMTTTMLIKNTCEAYERYVY